MLRPLNGRVVLKVHEVKATSKSGILLSAINKSAEKIAKVVATSDIQIKEGNHLTSELDVGDEVVYDMAKCEEVYYSGERYLITHEKDILAVIEKGSN